ncbi:hypothetical protein [Promicromonospora soli]
MAVIALCSAQGSPGVTTTAVGLALTWPRPVLLVEADPTGSSGVLTGWFGGARDYESGLIELAFASEPVADLLPQVSLALDDTDPDHRARFIAGPRSHVQARGLRDLWSPLAGALADLDETGQDVIVDAGRLGAGGSPTHLLASADLTVMLLRSHLPAVAGARAWAELVRRDRLWPNPGLIVVGPGDPYGPREVTRVLGLPVIATLPDDPPAAAVYHRGSKPPRHFESGGYHRSLSAAAEALISTVARTRGEVPSVKGPVIAALLERAGVLKGTDGSDGGRPGSDELDATEEARA